MEEWKFIGNSKFYQISTYGRVRCVGGVVMRRDNKPFTVKACVMKPYLTKCGYFIVHGACDLDEHILIHRTMMVTFNPVDGMDNLQVNHIDGNKQNNVIENLEWCTREENMQHAIRTGLWTPTYRPGELHPMCTLSDEQARDILDLLKEKTRTQHSIAVEYGISDTTVHAIKVGKKRFANIR